MGEAVRAEQLLPTLQSLHRAYLQIGFGEAASRVVRSTVSPDYLPLGAQFVHGNDAACVSCRFGLVESKLRLLIHAFEVNMYIQLIHVCPTRFGPRDPDAER